MTDRPTSNETDRRIGDVARLGVVEAVDLAAGRCTVRVGDLVSGPIPWIAPRAGATRIWSPPSPGEQVLLLCEDGDLALGVALSGVFSTANPAPTDADVFHARFADDAVIVYDPAAHTLEATLPAGGVITLTAPGGVTLNTDASVTVNAPAGVDCNGDLRVAGQIHATGDIASDGDVKAGPITLKTHKTAGVQPGGGVSGFPTP